LKTPIPSVFFPSKSWTPPSASAFSLKNKSVKASVKNENTNPSAFYFQNLEKRHPHLLFFGACSAIFF